ncbi:MAG TPA: DUF58 domain-containing protein [Candidatus Thermoplasmatota archaeon]|nr:DUF58 domain-containing protein [Candidatus Thermoplasmatota archaeon]
MITAKGRAYLAGGVLALLAGVVAGSAALAAAGVLFLSALLVAGLLRRDLSISVRRSVQPQRLREGEWVDVDLAVANSGTTAGFLEVAETLSERLELSGKAREMLALRPRETAALRYRLRAHVKGVYSVGPLAYRVEDVFGLFAEDLQHPEEAYFTAIPGSDDAEVEAKSRIPKGYLGEHIVRSPGQGMEFFGLREYVRSDPLKEVNWKASARAGELIVNQRERESITDVAVFYDCRAASGRGTATVNGNVLGARAVASMLEILLARRDRMKFVSYGPRVDVVQPDTGDRMRHKVLNLLSALEPAGDTRLLQAVEAVLPTLSRQTPVIVVSNLEEDASVVEAVSRLRARELNVLVLSPRAHFPTADASVVELAAAERAAVVAALRAAGARVLDWDPQASFSIAMAKGALL